MKKFKKGDKVICIDNSGNHSLNRGQIAIVDRCDDLVYIIGEPFSGFYEWRFKLAKEYLFDKLYLTLKS